MKKKTIGLVMWILGFICYVISMSFLAKLGDKASLYGFLASIGVATFCWGIMLRGID